MIEISKFIIVDKIFNESECCKIIDSKSEFIKSPEEQQNNKKSLIVPDESNYTFGHTNFPYWHLEFSDENEWFFEKVRESIDMVNMKFFKFTFTNFFKIVYTSLNSFIPCFSTTFSVIPS